MQGPRFLKKYFPYFTKESACIYLDSAATSQKPQTLIDAYTRLISEGSANVHRSAYRLAGQRTDEFEAARATVASFIGADTSEIIWTKGATEAINLVARCYVEPLLQSGDVIVLSELEHHANLVPWQQLCLRTGAQLRFIPVDASGQLSLLHLSEIINEQVKFVAITAMSNVLGSVTPIQDIIARAKALGVAVLIDAAQYAAHEKIDVRAWGCDFLCFSAHKLFGPTGLGVLYAKAKHQNHMSPWLYGGEMVTQVDALSAEFQQGQLKFEAGTPAINEAIAFAEVIQWLNSLNREEIFRQERRLLARLEYGLDQIQGLTRYSNADNRDAIACFSIAGFHSSDVAALLDSRGIAVRAGQLCAMPLVAMLNAQGVIRVSISMYTDTDDIDALLIALHEMIANETNVDSLTTTQKVSSSSDDELMKALCNARAWEQKSRLLMQWGREASTQNVDLRRDDYRVHGCESATWISGKEVHDRWHFVADSEARLVRGLLCLVLSRVNEKSSAEILNMDLLDELNRAGLSAHLSASRNNGIVAVVQQIQKMVSA